jgi:uncharacterized protein (DUF924 family)
MQQQILDFWFGKLTEPSYGQQRREWFQKDPAFDQTIRDQFMGIYTQAASGELANWPETPSGCLALVIVLDQFPRNMFRGTPEAFATDPQALTVAQTAVNREFDCQLQPVQRWFIYLPFEHSEDLAHQQQCVRLFEQLRHDPASVSTIDFAYRHLQIIEQFGRFPHRNAILGRASTPAELEFLQQPGSGF